MEITIKADTLINELLGANATVETVELIRAKLSKIVLPWQEDGCLPPKFVRKTGLGVQLGIVDSFLGGYGSPHKPELHGVGWKANTARGQGACNSGIVKVDTGNLVIDREFVNSDEIKACRDEAFAKAKANVDEFIRTELHGYTLLGESDSV